MAALWLAPTTPALAQGATTSRLHAPSAPAPDDGLGPRDLLLQADTLIEDKARNTVTAIGHVEARYQGRTLRTDRLDYNTQTGAAHAVGHSVVVNADGTTQYGDDVVLDDQFRAAVSIGFAAREADNVTLAAGAAVRRNEVVNQLNNAAYTTCNICAENGAPKNPSWKIQATRIIEDRQHQVIYYRNAVIRILGIPVFYSPIFWHPDPTSPRRSGLLTPRIEISKRRGFSIEQPYLFTLGPSTDLIVSPQINTRVNPLLNVRYTERFYSGLIDVRAGYTYEYNFDNHVKFGDDTSRSYILARGLFDIAPDWVWGFGAERVSDPTFFQRYAIHDVYTDRGPFPADTDRLITQLYTVREDQQSYLSAAVLDFESLRAFGVDSFGRTIVESTRAFPLAAPVIEARYDPTEPVFGGALKLQASAVSLTRNSPVISVFDPSGATPQGPQEFGSGTLGVVAGTVVAAGAQLRNLSALQYTQQQPRHRPGGLAHDLDPEQRHPHRTVPDRAGGRLQRHRSHRDHRLHRLGHPEIRPDRDQRAGRRLHRDPRPGRSHPHLRHGRGDGQLAVHQADRLGQHHPGADSSARHLPGGADQPQHPQ